MSTEDVQTTAPATLKDDPWTLASHICIRPKIDASGIAFSAKTAAQEVALARLLQYVLFEHIRVGSPDAAAAVGKVQRWIVDMVDSGRSSGVHYGIEAVFPVFSALKPFCHGCGFENIKCLVRIFLELCEPVRGDFTV